MPRVARSPEGHELRLVEGARIKMGASRREPGRRANETLREVELVRPFYVAMREVTNEQYRRFEPQHSSGRVEDQSLDIDDAAGRARDLGAGGGLLQLAERPRRPASRVRRAGRQARGRRAAHHRLPPAHRGGVVERVARYPDGSGPLKYPWGPSLPVPPAAANYADASARAVVTQVLAGYDDGYTATAPVDSFRPTRWASSTSAATWRSGSTTSTRDAERRAPLVRDPVGPAEGEYHVILGSSFLHGTVTELRLSYRDFGKDRAPTWASASPATRSERGGMDERSSYGRCS